MLVDAEPVVAELLGVLHLVEVLVVERVAALRIVVAVRQRDPRRGVPAIEIVGQVRPRHEMEVEELDHGYAEPEALICVV